MTGDVNWDDPLSADDEAARERARRRAEREARRAKRRGKLADKVRKVQAESPAEPEAAAPGESRSPVTTERPSVPPITGTPGRSAQEEPPPAELPGADSPATEAHTQAAAAPAPASAAEPTPQPAAAPPAGPPPAVVHRRRLAALVGLAALAFVGLVIVVGVNQLGGDDPAPAAPLKAQKTFDLTIPEGYRRDQIADVAKKAGVKGDYAAASKSVKGFDPGKYGAENPSSLEGFLFPATYEEFKGKTTAEDLVKDQLDAFKQNITGVDLSYAKSKNLTTYDVLIIASMVQAEAANTDEMPQIAEVIYNRLSDGTPLGIDATIRYGLNNWTEPLTNSELATDSPYNTRLVAGLPPTPIGNPGLAAIEAAAKPAEGNLLYFVVKPGTCGHAFFDNEADFNAAVAEYNTAREAAGGKSPDTC
jgi:hypothetical protein